MCPERWSFGSCFVWGQCLRKEGCGFARNYDFTMRYLESFEKLQGRNKRNSVVRANHVKVLAREV